jgi:S-adenosylmethionine hydrolase
MSSSDNAGIGASPHEFHCLTFLTDYGLEDAFVAACHGVAAQIAPDIRIIDITHLIPPGDIRRGAVVLAQAVPYFPPAVHVAVVDPGVGTARRAVALQAGRSLFVGPDNGLLMAAVTAAGGATRAVELTSRALWRDTVTATFHGRDIFMPAAAWLARGVPLDRAGDPIEVSSLVTLPEPASRVTGGAAQAEVVTVDRFGNAQLSLTGAAAAGAGFVPGVIVALAWAGQQVTLPFATTFGDVAPGDLVCYRDSSDAIAVAVAGGDAARRLGLSAGTPVTLKIVRNLPNSTPAPAHARDNLWGTIRDIPTGRAGVTTVAWLLRRVRPRVLRPALAALLVAATPVTLAASASAQAQTGAQAQVQVRQAGTAAGPTRAGEWWLTALEVPAAWHDAPARGAGVTVAVLSTGVDAGHPDLTGSVTTGPDFSRTGREPGGPYWGAEGTAVASLIAGHGHGPGRDDGITGVAPGARILSVQVTLEYDDPLNSDAAVTGRLTAAIAEGIRYAVSHQAKVIALPLDPGTLGSPASGDPAAAGGSTAELAAVRYAVAHDVLLIAPAGDNGAGTGTVNYPAAYPGVIAVGATGRDGQLSAFTNDGPYVALTAPGSGVTPPGPGAGSAMTDPAAGLLVAAPCGGYQSLASTDMSSALAAGVAALIRGRYPRLTAAEVTRALEEGSAVPPAARSGPGQATAAKAGWGHGALDAATALTAAAAIAAAQPAPGSVRTPAPSPASTPKTSKAVSPVPARTPRPAARGRADPGAAIRSVLLDLVLAASGVIAALTAALAIARLRRARRSSRPARGTPPVPARHARTPPAPRQLPAISPPPGPAGSQWTRPRPSPPAEPRPQAPDAPLAPWERSPAEYSAGPYPFPPDQPSSSASSSGPMYIWNPAEPAD